MSAWRQLSDDELFELSQSNQGRLEALTAQGVGIGGLGEHYMIALLEEMAGERVMAAAREKHHMWLKEQLDAAEPKIRQARFMQGVAPANGQPERRHPNG